MRGGDAHMTIENIYLFFIYILFFYLTLSIIIVVSLLVALIATVRKLDKQKNTSLLEP